MGRSNDTAILCGDLAGTPELSHTGRDGAYYVFPLAVKRLSGAVDTLNVLAEERLCAALDGAEPGTRIRVCGEVRSFNNKSGNGPRLVISVLARSIEYTDDECDNRVYLSGTICKEPTLRKTPMGREICDIMLAVNRKCGRSDYLPCIIWGAQARQAGEWTVGTDISINGRMQSRVYIKNAADGAIEKTAYEISAVDTAKTER